LKIKVIGSANGPGERHQYLLSYVCNQTVAIDAGCIGMITPLAEQSRIKHVFLTHSHLDHTASLPQFLDNVYSPGPDCPNVYAHPATLESLRSDFFNERVWPDLERLSRDESPFLRLVPVLDSQATSVDGLTVTAVELLHVVPTFAYTISDGTSTVAIVSDTSPSERIWEVLNGLPKLDALFLEVSFPNSMRWVADKAMHLTPKTFGEELAKLRRSVRTLAVHVKPAFRASVLQEVADLHLPQVEFVDSGTEYEF
jgi:ribonuclease BN (tRNA processing enzyme)